MQVVNCMVALGGDRGNTVPKYLLPVSEVAVLQRIHGADAVFDIVLATNDELVKGQEHLEAMYEAWGGVEIEGDEIIVENRGDLDRLKATYARAKNEDNKLLVEDVYPGTGARVFQYLDDMSIPEDCYKAIARAKPEPVAKVERKAPKRRKKEDEDILG